MARKLAVVIPTFDRIESTHLAVNSVETAFPEEVEIVVIDDCGCEPYVVSAPMNRNGIPVRVMRAPENGGAGRARMLGVESTDCDFIAFLDSDDRFGCSWVDSILGYLGKTEAGIMVVGRVENGSAFNRKIFNLIERIPERSKVYFARFLMVFFNPFYTPAVSMSSAVCEFSESLRFCEDYYTNFIGVFRSTRLVTTEVAACTLGRTAGSAGGLSNLKWKMFHGEMQVRIAILRSPYVPLFFKALVPFGMTYQIVRTLLKLLMGVVRA